jgi:protein gp37
MAEAARWADLTGTARKDKPWLDGMPRLIFVSDMSDALSAEVPLDFLRQEIVSIVTSPNGQRHQWLWLTKRPDRMAQFSTLLKAKGLGWPGNLWAGTSITTQATTSRIKNLLCVGDENTVRFLSVEPQRERIDLGQWLPRLGWVIQGGESGRGARPFQLEWALDLRSQCKDAGVSYFLKQLGSAVFSGDQRLSFRHGHAGDWSEWPTEARVREMPRRVASTLRRYPLPLFVGDGTTRPDKRVSLEVVEDESKGRHAALKAWETRRRKQDEQKRNAAALKARETRKENERKRKRSEAAKKAWRTRRDSERNGAG